MPSCLLRPGRSALQKSYANGAHRCFFALTFLLLSNVTTLCPKPPATPQRPALSPHLAPGEHIQLRASGSISAMLPIALQPSSFRSFPKSQDVNAT